MKRLSGDGVVRGGDDGGGDGGGVVADFAALGGVSPFAQATRLAGAGGTVVAFGITTHATDVTPYEWYTKELTIHNPRAARPRDCDSAIELCAHRRLDLASLVTVRFPLARLADALAAARDPAQLKVVINVAPAPPRP